MARRRASTLCLRSTASQPCCRVGGIMGAVPVVARPPALLRVAAGRNLRDQALRYTSGILSKLLHAWPASSALGLSASWALCL